MSFQSQEYSDKERDEFIFHIFKRLCVGGGMCQYEDLLQPYVDLTKLVYKVCVRACVCSKPVPKSMCVHVCAGPKVCVLASALRLCTGKARTSDEERGSE